MFRPFLNSGLLARQAEIDELKVLLGHAPRPYEPSSRKSCPSAVSLIAKAAARAGVKISAKSQDSHVTAAREPRAATVSLDDAGQARQVRAPGQATAGVRQVRQPVRERLPGRLPRGKASASLEPTYPARPGAEPFIALDTHVRTVIIPGCPAHSTLVIGGWASQLFMTVPCPAGNSMLNGLCACGNGL